MPARYGVSPWIDECPASRVPTFPRFRGAHSADVVVVGGGLTGCAAAYACASAGLETILLERDRIGRGRTGRSAGLLMPEPGVPFRDVAAAHGLRSARRVFELWRRGAIDGAALLRRLRINCYLDGRETTIVARRDEEQSLRREYGARRAAGLDVAWLTQKQVQARMRLDAAAALKLRDSAMLDPYRACLGLAAAVAAREARCFERSRVKKVRFTRRHADVIVDGGTIRTRKVIIATSRATAEFKSLQRHFDEREAYVVATDRVPAAMRRGLGDPQVVVRDLACPPTHIALFRGEQLIVAGADQRETPARTRPAVLVQRTGQLMYETLKMYTAISGLQPAYGWDVPYGETADGLMYIGAHRNFPHHLFALGEHALSVTGAFVAARILVRAVQEAPEKGDEVFSWTR